MSSRCRPGVVLVSSRCRPHVVPVWSRCGPSVVPVWSGCVPGVVPVWSRCHPDVVPMLSRQSYFIKSFDGGLQCEFNQTFIATLRSQICVLFTTKIPIMNGFLPKNVLVTTIQDTYSVRSKTLHCYEMNQCTMFISL